MCDSVTYFNILYDIIHDENNKLLIMEIISLEEIFPGYCMHIDLNVCSDLQLHNTVLPKSSKVTCQNWYACIHFTCQ